MPRRPTFEPVETAKGWMVSIPENMTEDSKRVRKYFKLKKAATAFAGGLRAKYHVGERGGVITHDLAVMADVAARMLEPHGATILDAARAFVARAEDGKSPETFAERYDRARLENEEHWSDRYKLDMDRLPRWVGREFMERRVCDITPAIIDAAIRAHGAIAQSTVDMHRRYVSAALNHETRHRKLSEVHIMSRRQCAQMLRACESPEERRAVGLLLFAGIRPSAEDGEITRLDWSAVGADEIYLSKAVSKVGDRHIPITGRLRRLLRGHPTSGTVIPSNWRRVYKRLRAAVDDIAGKQDITRHTFASHYLAAYDEKAAKQAMGHTEGSQTLFRHYRRAVTEADGLKYFR